MILTRQQLLRDLYTAYYCAKRNKSKMSYVKTWEFHFHDNMESLCDDLFYRRYEPMPSKCFIVDYPKKRETNVYLNVLDQYCKRMLKCKYYGRYVDDAVIVSADKEWLLSLVQPIENFLKDELHLDIHKGKLKISEVHCGIEFLGAFIKPYRTYISNDSLQRIKSNFRSILRNRQISVSSRLRTINSYLGILSHYSTFKIRRRMFFKREILRLGVFNEDMTKMTERHQYFYSLLKTI